MLRIELVRAGNHNGVLITPQDLQELKSTFHGEVPVTLGHSLADFMPAVGWVKAVELKDGSLIGEVELNDLLKEAYKQGLYRKWSVGIRRGADGKKYLHHLAFLGEVPPKIKDLKVIKSIDMSDVSETWQFEAADSPPALSSLEVVDRAWDVSEARRRVFEKYGIEGLKEYCLYRDPEADPENKTAYKFLVVDIVDGEPKIIAKALSAALAYLHGARGVNIPEEVRRKVEPKIERLMKKKEEDNMSEQRNDELEAAKERLYKLEHSLRQLKREALKEAMAGRIPQAKHALVMELADRLGLEEIELSDGEKKVKTSAVDLLIEILRSIPLPVKTGELDMGDVQKDEGIDARKIISRV